LIAAAMVSKRMLHVSSEELQTMHLDEECSSLIQKHGNAPTQILAKLVVENPFLLSDVSKFSIIPLTILVAEKDAEVCGLAVEGLRRLSAQHVNCAIMKESGVLKNFPRLLKKNKDNPVLLTNALKSVSKLGVYGNSKLIELFTPLLVKLLPNKDIDVRSAAMNLLCQFDYFKRS
jgi:hypothetical protein